jgi:hypothetical protein
MHTYIVELGGHEFRVQGTLPRIARLSSDRFDAVDDPEAARAALQQSTTRIDLFTFMQLLPDVSPQYAYPMEWDNVAGLPVSTFDHWWLKQIDSRTRACVRMAAKKGVVVREVPFDDRLVRGIAAVYHESPVRQGRRFPHYGKDVDTIRRENGTFLDQSIFIAAFCDDTIVGFAKLVCDRTRHQAGLMQILAMLRHRDKAATNALIAQAVRSCADRRIASLVYAQFRYARKQRDGLSDFKRHNGFRPVNVPRYYIPLTPIGRAALRLGLHHPLVNRMPESLLAWLRAARSRWYRQPRRPRPEMNAR